MMLKVGDTGITHVGQSVRTDNPEPNELGTRLDINLDR